MHNFCALLFLKYKYVKRANFIFNNLCVDFYSCYTYIRIERSVRMNYYNKDIKEVIEDLSSREKGLGHDEVLKRRKIYKLNEITDVNKVTPLKRF